MGLGLRSEAWGSGFAGSDLGCMVFSLGLVGSWFSMWRLGYRVYSSETQSLQFREFGNPAGHTGRHAHKWTDFVRKFWARDSGLEVEELEDVSKVFYLFRVVLLTGTRY